MSQGHDTPLGHEQQLREILSRLGDKKLWPRYDVNN